MTDESLETPLPTATSGPGAVQITCLVIGWAVIIFALHGMISERAANPPGLFKLLIGLNIVNDALVIPIVLALSVLMRRLLPKWALLPTQFGLFASAIILLYAYPLIGGWGHSARAGYSRLPYDYAHNIWWPLGAIALACGFLAIWQRRRHSSSS